MTPQKNTTWMTPAISLIVGIVVVFVTLYVNSSKQAQADSQELNIRKLSREEAEQVITAPVERLTIAVETIGKKVDDLATDVREIRNKK